MKKYSTFILVLFLGIFIACKSGGEPNNSLELLRRPYLQSAIADSLTVLWRTNEGTNAKLAFKQPEESKWSFVSGQTRKTNTGIIENEVALKSLIPNTAYQYRIYTDDVLLLEQDSLYFRSPINAQDSVFSFFAVGDIGEAVEDEGTPDKLGQALIPFVDSLNFGLLLGDIIYPDGRSEDYDTNLFQYFGEVFPYVPVFTVLGNHDWHEPEENYMKEWKLPGNEHYYSFDYGNVHFIGLDTKNGELYNYNEQVAWFQSDLATSKKQFDWIIVFLHHNGKSCTYKNDYEGVVSLYPIFDEYGVDLVLNGHAHTYERLNPMNGKGEIVDQSEGFTSITVGSGGKLRGIGTDPKPFVPNPDSCKYPGLVATYTHDWAFLNLEISGKQLKGTAITTKDLKQVDRFEINK